MIDVLHIISRMQEEKKDQSISPSHIPFIDLQREIQKELKNELNSLAKDGKIGVTRTVNSKAVYIK